MSNYKASEQDRKNVENIRRQYISREEDKMTRLQKLDDKVKLPGNLTASVLWVIGSPVIGGRYVTDHRAAPSAQSHPAGNTPP